ncbi:MAG TPA: hypothetical protein VI934_02085 [Candidatus Nanoarchaeia archaeon]|nr:hypothetical protein [Candidatus Nanoarchaeia archaeon]
MKDGSGNGQVCAILSYFFIGIVWFFVDEKMKKDSLAKFHVKQAIILLIFSVIWSILLQFLSVFVVFLARFLSVFLFFLSIPVLLSYVPLVFAIIGILNALNKKEKELPVIGSYAKKLPF